MELECRDFKVWMFHNLVAFQSLRFKEIERSVITLSEMPCASAPSAVALGRFFFRDGSGVPGM